MVSEAVPWSSSEYALELAALQRRHEAAVARVHELERRAADLAAANAALASQNQSLRATRQALDFVAGALAAVPEPLAVVDADLRVRLANVAFDVTFGFASGPDEPPSLDDPVHGRWATPDLVDRLRAALTLGGQVDDVEAVYARPGLPARTFVVSARSMGRDGAALLVVGLRDITARKELEAARLREAECAQTAVVRASFLDAISHELRTPLNAIVLWAKLLRRSDLDAEALHRGLDVIDRSARAEAQLVADLLDVSVVARPPTALHVTPARLDPRPVVRAALAVVAGEAEAKRITIETAFADDADEVLADPQRLEQITWQLACNAIKFTPAGGAVRVSLVRAGIELELAVRDTGCGIPATFLPYVFDAFTQADQAITRGHDGLGIGLALVRHLVERQGGRITAQSAGEGGGAVFTVRLPLCTA